MPAVANSPDPPGMTLASHSGITQPEEAAMRVRDIMTPDPITIEPQESIEEALGILTRRDLQMSIGPAIKELDGDAMDPDILAQPVSDVMTHDVKAVYEDTDMTEACRILASLRIGALPVMGGGRLVGILSVTDLLVTAADLLEGAG
jgi:CBS domain-containing protein